MKKKGGMFFLLFFYISPLVKTNGNSYKQVGLNRLRHINCRQF
jgi:hypothetical protein